VIENLFLFHWLSHEIGLLQNSCLRPSSPDRDFGDCRPFADGVPVSKIIIGMLPSPNLICESLLINATLDYLKSSGGRASAVRVVDRVMNISNPLPNIAVMLVADLVERDRRLRLCDDFVELVDFDHDAVTLEDAGFVVLDLETTGAKAPPCRVTEIGAFRVKGNAIVDKFHTLVDPEMPIPPFISALTGISNEMVAGAPKFSSVVPSLLEFIGDSVIVAHNARFDMGFLNYEIGRVYEDYRLGNPSLCTVQLSRNLLPAIENHKLNTVARHFEIELINHHRACEDAYATAQIFLNLLSDLADRGVRDLRSARRFTLRTFDHKNAREHTA
jgi:DNA polymerase III epsilon subunit family exonuclease